MRFLRGLKGSPEAIGIAGKKHEMLIPVDSLGDVSFVRTYHEQMGRSMVL
jgi:hypothetical protein